MLSVRRPFAQVILDGARPYWDPEVQSQVETLLQTFENSTYVTDRLYTDCWLREWVSLLENSRGILNLNVSTPAAWVATLKEVGARSRASEGTDSGCRRRPLEPTILQKLQIPVNGPCTQ